MCADLQGLDLDIEKVSFLIKPRQLAANVTAVAAYIMATRVYVTALAAYAMASAAHVTATAAYATTNAALL